MFKTVTRPIMYGLVFAAVPMKQKESAVQPATIPAAESAVKMRACDLPVYPPGNSNKKCHSQSQPSEMRSTVEGGIGFVRKNVSSVCNSISSETKRVDDFYQTGKEHSRFIFDYLNEPSNTVSRTGAIAVGAASGFIIGLRGGMIKRLFYSLIGAGGVASVCYPKEADQYAQLALAEAKTYATIAYNFAYGVKPGEEIKTPKIPSNYSEIVDSIRSMFK